MRLLLASHGYPPTISGVTVVVQKLARAMTGRGHHVVVLTASDRGEPYQTTDQEVTVIRVRSTANPFWKEGPIPLVTQREVEKIVKEWQPDVIHAHEAGLLARHLLGLARERDIPILSTCHYVPNFTTHYLNTINEVDAVVESIIWSYSVRLHNQFDTVVFPSQAHRRLFLDQGLRASTRVISNGVDIQRYRPASQARDDPPLPYELPPAPRVLFVSRLARDKRIDVLIRAIPHVLESLEAHLLLAGRGDDRPRLEELARQLQVGEQVHFLGFVPEEHLPALYQAASLFAIASTCEVQSIPTLQALATGLPVVAVDALALPELVHDDVNGYLVTPDSHRGMARAILRVLGNPERAARMGHNSLLMAQSHSDEHTFAAYETLYHTLLHTRGRTSS